MRYIGNKKKILSEIEKLINKKELNNENYTFCDAFCGTATVSCFFKDRFRIIANDNMFLSYVMAYGKLNTPSFEFKGLNVDPFEYFNKDYLSTKGFVYENYSTGGSDRMYFSEENAMRIDYIRTKIEKWYNKQFISENEYFYLIACLLESVSKVSNVAGVYGSYLKSWDSRALKKMNFIHVEQENDKALFENEVYNKSIESLISDISGDILYLDPPYTKNQYATQYHVLETIALYDNPELKGKTGARDSKEKSSNFSRDGYVHIEFEKIISKAKFRHIIISYSSKGIMSKTYIESVLKRHGIEETFDFVKIPYRRYLNSKTETKTEIYEYLFYIEKDLDSKVLYSSPLNYIGGKGDMLDFILENSPTEFNRVVDLFGGGFNVGVNYDDVQIIYNDCNFKVKELIELFRNYDTAEFYKYISKTIKKFNLEKNDKESYVNLRTLYNTTETYQNPKVLYLLILFGFQQQIRFNSNYQYNNPVGQAGMNDKILEKIISYCRNLKEKNVVLLSSDFEDVDEYINPDTFVYCDPPYLITLGSYNDGKRGFNGWNDDDENRLLRYLEDLSNRGVRFMLSNVLEHNGVKNELLIAKINQNNWRVIEYTGKTRKKRKEVIIVNY